MKNLKNAGITLFLIMLFPYSGFAQEPVEVWSKSHEWGADRSIAVDSTGNTYVAGSDGMDYITLKYDRYGNELWNKRYDGGSWDRVSAMVIDSSDNVYVTGESYNVATQSDFATVKYDGNGNELWARRYNGTANYYDGATALAIDATGNVFVTGWSYGDGYDYNTVKYDTNGNELWVKRYDGDPWSERPTALAIDSRGNTYVTGQSGGYYVLAALEKRQIRRRRLLPKWVLDAPLP